MSSRNREQYAYWNEEAGPKWAAAQEALDAQLRPWNEALFEAFPIAETADLLDVGCGCGDTTLALARRAHRGDVLGVDLSAPMLARARERAADAGPTNVTFRQADAQTEAFGVAARDAVLSRFGVMFFDDPAAAFANLGRTLRPGGRIAFLCWQDRARNPWVGVPMTALASVLPLPEAPADPYAPGPFSMADAERTRGILEAAGFSAVESTSVEREPSWGDLETATSFFTSVGPAATLLRESDAEPGTLAKATGALVGALATHRNASGEVILGAATWLVTATRA